MLRSAAVAIFGDVFFVVVVFVLVYPFLVFDGILNFVALPGYTSVGICFECFGLIYGCLGLTYCRTGVILIVECP